ncbi:type II toxin-antitoxin system VapC family toxin [Gelria sp. Kuro-4]|uniref:type II toxin-antitoxin system VapC family toxin n=1 Tax=Gelria sp. Kuro-4 TaxID=2796927 RepID=UPI001BED5EA3|nr:type II toxin-antitoxin system VapC family toxin [Gelria sp. Kuro-4]BCV24839.1 twitching motility protein PilT [Gelria sp. Kuro-4]
MTPYVLDSYALLVYFQDEPGADEVESLFRKASQGEAVLFLSAVNYGEVAYSVKRKAGGRAMRSSLALLDLLPIEVVSISRDLALTAALYKAKYPIAYADCFCLALAKQQGAAVVTGDPEFHKVESEITFKWLPEKQKNS